MPVTVRIVGGQNVAVPWKPGMNAQNALEDAWMQLNSQLSAPQLTYALQYFGSIGYLVTMINETYETFSVKGKPYYYWDFYYNNSRASVGIDGQLLNDGDFVEFAFESYDPATDTDSTWKKAKHV